LTEFLFKKNEQIWLNKIIGITPKSLLIIPNLTIMNLSFIQLKLTKPIPIIQLSYLFKPHKE